jgi:hypothetical protein
MPGRKWLASDALLSTNETEALLALLSDVSRSHGDDPEVREAGVPAGPCCPAVRRIKAAMKRPATTATISDYSGECRTVTGRGAPGSRRFP